jgi:hypothetical protein
VFGQRRRRSWSVHRAMRSFRGLPLGPLDFVAENGANAKAAPGRGGSLGQERDSQYGVTRLGCKDSVCQIDPGRIHAPARQRHPRPPPVAIGCTTLLSLCTDDARRVAVYGSGAMAGVLIDPSRDTAPTTTVSSQPAGVTPCIAEIIAGGMWSVPWSVGDVVVTGVS